MDAITIRQIEVPSPGAELLTLTLSGRCSPLIGTKVGGQQRHNLSYADGNPNADVRFSGSTEDPTVFKFDFRTHWMGPTDAILNDQPITNADDLQALLHDIRRGEALVLVTWIGIDQVGLITASEATRGQAGCWKFELTFQPASPPEYPLSATTPVPAPESEVEKLIGAFEDALLFVESAATWADATIADVELAISDVREVLARLETDANAVQNRRQRVENVWKQIAAGERQLEQTAAAMRHALDIAPNVCQTDEPAQQIAAQSYVAEVGNAAQVARMTAALSRANYRPERDWIAIHVAVQGDTIYSLAWKYYTDIALADLIAARNPHIINDEIPAHTEVVIPKRPSNASR